MRFIKTLFNRNIKSVCSECQRSCHARISELEDEVKQLKRNGWWIASSLLATSLAIFAHVTNHE